MNSGGACQAHDGDDAARCRELPEPIKASFQVRQVVDGRDRSHQVERAGLEGVLKYVTVDELDGRTFAARRFKNAYIPIDAGHGRYDGAQVRRQKPVAGTDV